MTASTVQLAALALAFAAMTFLIHRLHRAFREHRFLPLTPEMKGSKSGMRPGGREGTGPFVDMHQARTIQRALAGTLILSWLWMFGLVTLLLVVTTLKSIVERGL
ncbi:MAG: hypothetical protein ACAH11_00285 [Sphingomonas sp.]